MLVRHSQSCLRSDDSRLTSAVKLELFSIPSALVNLEELPHLKKSIIPIGNWQSSIFNVPTPVDYLHVAGLYSCCLSTGGSPFRWEKTSTKFCLVPLIYWS